jgi:hypothetical protein
LSQCGLGSYIAALMGSHTGVYGDLREAGAPVYPANHCIDAAIVPAEGINIADYGAGFSGEGAVY